MRLALAFVVVVAFVACRRAPTGPTTTTPSNATPRPSYSATAADELGFLPIDAEMVFGVDAVALRRSELWRQYEGQVVNALGPSFQDLKAQCGFDPIVAITRLTMAGNMANEKFSGVMVIHGIPTQQMLACATKLQDKAQATGVTMTVDKDVITLIGKDARPTVMKAIDASTFVAQIGPSIDITSLATILASGAPLRRSPAFMKLFDRRERGAAMWAMVNGNSEAIRPLRQTGINARSIDGTMIVTDRFTAAVRLTLDDAAAADAFVQQMDPMADRVRGFVEKLELRTIGTAVQLEVVITEEQLRTLVALAGMGGS